MVTINSTVESPSVCHRLRLTSPWQANNGHQACLVSSIFLHLKSPLGFQKSSVVPFWRTAYTMNFSRSRISLFYWRAHDFKNHDEGVWWLLNTMLAGIRLFLQNTHTRNYPVGTMTSLLKARDVLPRWPPWYWPVSVKLTIRPKTLVFRLVFKVPAWFLLIFWKAASTAKEDLSAIRNHRETWLSIFAVNDMAKKWLFLLLVQ